ncbi:hypothetical protein Marme_1252 [Marinomonas mediterranea MMB-1]|jgi:hypothetical protein|uniref:Uncharacterized protein n=1 Tax=Marinomonas mediterranea (strain ATCC 700492 / JCM 21426 / NBRC 103028 / MMB-1) TaxID=717774 RepID=F2JVI1_MARM1|nr:hypothetical protein Marme_1252 [Marinomonas mediterranea MMB-1]
MLSENSIVARNDSSRLLFFHFLQKNVGHNSSFAITSKAAYFPIDYKNKSDTTQKYDYIERSIFYHSSIFLAFRLKGALNGLD